MAGLFKKCRHPYVSFLYFIAVTGLTLTFKHPYFLAASLVMALVTNIILKNWNGLKTFLKLIPFFCVLSCLNPLVSHYGNTVLFYLWTDTSLPVTLEALVYGLNSGLLMITVTLWCFASAKILSAEKLTYIFAPVFPVLAVMFVMILRMLPFYSRRAVEISEGRKGLGLDKEKSFTGKLKEKMNVLNAVTSSTLEDGKYTADSMIQRGWGAGKRSCFIRYRFGAGDFLLCIILFACTVVSVWSAVNGGGTFTVYPEINLNTFGSSPEEIAGFSSNVVLMIAFAVSGRNK